MLLPHKTKQGRRASRILIFYLISVVFLSAVALQADDVPFRTRAPRQSFTTTRSVSYVWDKIVPLAEKEGTILARDEVSNFLLIKMRYEGLGIYYYANILVNTKDNVTEVSCFSSLSQYRFIEGCERFLNTLEVAVK
jgi:hypothetical protein